MGRSLPRPPCHDPCTTIKLHGIEPGLDGFLHRGLATAVVRWLLGEVGIFQALLTAMFDGARGFEISLGLAGIMAPWLGLMRVGNARHGRAAGAPGRPILRRLFPAVPDGRPAQGAMTLNISANLLGLDNAAHAPGPEGHAGAVDAEPRALGHRQQRPDHVRGRGTPPGSP